MTTVDDKVVAMSFENSKFESGVHATMRTLSALKKALQFPNAGKGLEGISAAANRTDLSHIGKGIDTLNSKFSALKLTGIAVMANIASQAVSAGARFIKAFTFAPVIDGLHEYENQLNSVQTILANTSDQGTNLKQVNSALNQLNTYADKTIYNFGQMTKNVGTFTAAGVDLKTSVASIKGISNLAALSGSSAEQASTAMYQLSQAISAGRVGLQDWNSVVNAGMGGAVFQKSLMRTAENMGALKDGAVQIDKATGKATVNGKSFRESIMSKPGEKSWLTGDVLTNTLKQLSGDMTDAQLKAEGFSDAQIKAIQSQSKLALDAATKVKTLSQLMDTTKEAIGSGWAQTWQLVFGDFGEAKHLFTGLATAIGGFVKKSANARNSVLKDWKKLGGRTLFLNALKEGFNNLVDVIRPVRQAFREIFPKKTGKDLFELTKTFNHFMQSLRPSPRTIMNIRKTFAGLFAVLDIGKMIVGGLFSVIGKLFGAVGHGSGGFLDLTGNIGDFLVSVDKALKKGGNLHKFFDTLGDVIATPIVLLGKLAQAIRSAFGGDAMGAASKSLGPLQNIINGLTRAWDKFLGSVGSTREIAKPALEGLSQMFGGIGQSIADALKGADFDAIFKVIEVGLLGGIFLTLKKALSGGLGNALAGGVLKSIVQAFTGVGGLTRSIGGTFNALTGSIQTMQQNVKSDTLKNIAISIALLAASIVGLSLVDPKRLNGALTAITIGFGQLLGAMAIMDKIGKSGGFIKMPVIAASMVVLAVAIDLLAVAVAGLSQLSWEQLGKGLGAVTVLLAGLSAASIPLSANSAGLIRAGAGITVIAVAMNILAQAVKSFGGMDMATLEKGIGGIAVSLAGIGAASRLFPTGMVAIGVGLIAIGAGLKLIVGSIEKLGNTDTKVLVKGIAAVAIALAGIGLAMRAMPGPAMLITAAGLILVSVALGKIAKAVQAFGGMSVTEIAKGLIAMGASLAILAVGLYAMSGTLAGSASLAVAAAGIALLAPALKMLGAQSWTQIIKGMVAMAAALGVLGIAATVLTPVVPAILALGVALIAVGAGLALAGAGVALIGVGLAAIAVAGPASVKILVDALTKLSESLPKVVANLAKALVQLVISVANAAPKFVEALGKILVALGKAIVAAAPQLTKAFTAILQLIFKVLKDNFPDLVKTGFGMLMALLKGIKNNIGQVVKMVVSIVGKFIGAIASSAGKLVSAGLTILLSIIKGVVGGFTRIVTTVTSLIAKFLSAIGNNLGKIAAAGLSILTKLLGGITNNLSKVLSMGTTIIVRLVRGIGNAAEKIATAALNTVTHFIEVMAREIPKQVNKIATAVIKMINAMAGVVRKRAPEFSSAMENLGVAIVQGIIDGVLSMGSHLTSALIKLAKDHIPGPFRKVLGIHSPSKVFHEIGQNIVLGLISGLKASSKSLREAMTGTVKNMLGAFGDEFSAKADLLIHDRIRKLGEDSIRTLYGLGVDSTSAMFDGMLSGMVDSNSDPVIEAFDSIQENFLGKIDDAEKAIEENKTNIRQAFKDIASDEAAYSKAKKAKDREGKLSALENKKQHKEELAAAKESWAANKDLLKILQDTSVFIKGDKSLQQWKKELQDQHYELDRINTDLDTQKQKLDDMVATRKGLFEQFSALPGLVTEDSDGNAIDPAVQVQNYINSLSGADDVVGKFSSSLDTLQGMNLNQDTYKQLLDIGPAAQGFADALIKLGPDGVNAINAADTDLRNASGTLAEHATTEMYGVGVSIVQGLIDGLEKDRLKVTAKAIELASLIVRKIKNKLGIKSPSQVFEEIGGYVVEGFAQGLTSSTAATDAATTMANDTIAAMKKSFASVVDVNPTITPVLDLTNIQNGAKTLDSMLNVVPITAAASFGQATSISSMAEAAQLAKDAVSDQAPIKFEQNNHSPEALSDIDIYRQTKNLLAQARPVLAAK